MKYLAVKGFRTFQHYKHRNPVWIKLYASILHDPSFIRLPEAVQAQLMKLWVLASQSGDPLPNDPKFLARAIGANRLRLDLLIAAGFLIPTDDASNGLSAGEQNTSTMSAAPRAREEGEVETEGETETEPSSSSAVEDAEADVARRLPTDADRNALTALVARVPNAAAWLASMRASLGGMAGHIHVTPAEMGQALRDFVANGAEPNGRLFRRYLQSAKQESSAPLSGARPPRPAERPAPSNAAAIMAQIRELIETHQAQAGPVRVIRRTRVAALGADVLRAYDALGGSERILATKPEHWGILTRDFADVLGAQGATAA